MPVFRDFQGLPSFPHAMMLILTAFLISELPNTLSVVTEVYPNPKNLLDTCRELKFAIFSTKRVCKGNIRVSNGWSYIAIKTPAQPERVREIHDHRRDDNCWGLCPHALTTKNYLSAFQLQSLPTDQSARYLELGTWKSSAIHTREPLSLKPSEIS